MSLLTVNQLYFFYSNRYKRFTDAKSLKGRSDAELQSILGHGKRDEDSEREAMHLSSLSKKQKKTNSHDGDEDDNNKATSAIATYEKIEKKSKKEKKDKKQKKEKK